MNGSLRPSTLVDILIETFTIYKNNYLKFAGIVGVTYLPIMVLVLIIILFIIIPFPEVFPDLMKDPSLMLYTLIPAGILLMLLFFGVITLMQGAMVYATAEQHFLQPLSIGRAFRFALQRIGNMMGAVLLAGLAVTVICLLIIGIPLAIYFTKNVTVEYWKLIAPVIYLAIICIPPATYFTIIWAFSLQTVLFEGCNPITALSRSFQLVRGSWWRVLGICLVLWLISMGINFVAGIIPLIGGFIAILVSLPVGAIWMTLLYFDLRVRKQGYNLDALAGELGLTSTPTDTAITGPPV